MYKAVSAARFRATARLLVSEDASPAWFAELEVVAWSGITKDLTLIAGAALKDCLLVDDFEGYMHPGQHEQWVTVACFGYRSVTFDRKLETPLRELKQRINHIDPGMTALSA